ncbi:hypothetical protein MLD38_030791 [Melastoma candidum]|uniref:Uncharacterized protein n=1 Tax=Melastoma candidum TaxID=119954 RepID=A0ACB9MMR9_9MYRT|nr:hypothetical protein MLD38_030791 [Melastoma candidum]
MGDTSDFPNALNNSKAIEITGKIMVIAIVVLFVVVVVVLFLHLYARWFWWRVMEEQPRPERNRSLRRRRRRFVFVPGEDNGIRMRRGLDSAVLCSIPVVVYRQEDFKDGLECAVCLCDVAEGEKARILPKCSHGFHVECIDMWFQSHSTCPLCRNSVTSEHNASNNGTGRGSVGVQSSSDGEGIPETEPDAVASHFPVNQLFWGDETRVSSRNGPMGGTNCEHPPSFSQESSSSSEGGTRPRREEALVIEIPRRMIEDMEPSPSPTASGCQPDEMKSPATGRLRSFRRLLSRERRVSPSSPALAAAIDIEGGGRNTSHPT